MPEDVENHFLLPNSTTPMTGTLREVLDDDITPRDKVSLNGLGMTKGKSGGLSMMLKTGMEVAQDCTIFNYRPPIPQKYLKSQGRIIVAEADIKPAPKNPSGHSKEKIGKKRPPDALIVDNLENCWPPQWIRLVKRKWRHFGEVYQT